MSRCLPRPSFANAAAHSGCSAPAPAPLSFAGALLGVIVGTVVVAQTLYASTKEHLNEFATLRAMGSSRRYIYKVIVWQALLSAVIGFSIAALVGDAVVRLTAATALPIVITPGLIVGLFLLTVVMCIGSSIAAIVQVTRIDPPWCSHDDRTIARGGECNEGPRQRRCQGGGAQGRKPGA